MFHFIRQISYVSTINFIFNHPYFHYYCYGFYFDLIGHFEFQLVIMFYYNIFRSRFENPFYLCHSIHF